MNRRTLRTALGLGLCAGLAVGATAPASAESTITPFIIDGKPAADGEYPFMVFLAVVKPEMEEGSFEMCGGSLIAPSWVLTAAHCTTNEEGTSEGLTVTGLYGTNDISGEEGTPLEVVQIVNHPDYDADTEKGVPNDIALLELAEPVEDAELIRYAEAGDEALFDGGSPVTAIGWGGTLTVENPDDQVTSDILLEVGMPVGSDDECLETYPVYDTDIHLCAGAPEPPPDNGPDTCQGDSGGPLIARDGQDWVQVGVVSYGGTCGQEIGMYARVAGYTDFITSTIGEDPSPDPDPDPTPDPDPSPTPEPDTFSDIDGNVHEERILAIAEAGITTGYTDGTYRPGVVVSRGQMAAFLARTLELEPGDPNRFPDSAGSVHATWIAAVADAGIAGGFGDGTYRADAPVTRGQMATFLTRAAGLPQGPLGSFTDVSGDVHERAIGAVKEAGIATGSGDGTYKPSNPVTRDQMATFLFRAFLQ